MPVSKLIDREDGVFSNRVHGSKPSKLASFTITDVWRLASFPFRMLLLFFTRCTRLSEHISTVDVVESSDCFCFLFPRYIYLILTIFESIIVFCGASSNVREGEIILSGSLSSTELIWSGKMDDGFSLYLIFYSLKSAGETSI